MASFAPAPCLVCGVELKPAFDDGGRQPSGATTFTTSGHYGSGLFDDMGGALLEINVCDGCLRDRADRAHLLRVKQWEQVDAYPWDPEVL